jgi:pimeloyl-[acyl-carrier protein] methyl ester esterase
MADALAPWFSSECIAVHGLGSGGAGGGVSDYASGLAECVARTNGAALLIGWSMGALVAMEAVAAGLCRPVGLVLLSGTARFTEAGPDYPFGHSAGNLRALRAALLAKPVPTLESFLAQVTAPVGLDPATRQPFVATALEQGTDALVAGLHYLERTDLREKLAGIRIPTLVVHGEEDIVVPWKAGAFAARAIFGSRFILMPEVGHGFVRDCGAAIASDILTLCGMKSKMG